MKERNGHFNILNSLLSHAQAQHWKRKQCNGNDTNFYQGLRSTAIIKYFEIIWFLYCLASRRLSMFILWKDSILETDISSLVISNVTQVSQVYLVSLVRCHLEQGKLSVYMSCWLLQLCNQSALPVVAAAARPVIWSPPTKPLIFHPTCNGSGQVTVTGVAGVTLVTQGLP